MITWDTVGRGGNCDNLIVLNLSCEKWESSQCIVVNVMDCNIIVSEFKLQLCYYILFSGLGKD